MYLAVKKTRGNTSEKPGDLTFIRIYRGAKTSCTVNAANLSNAYIDCSARPAIVFRIAAKNERGYGPATQIRWLQGLCVLVFFKVDKALVLIQSFWLYVSLLVIFPAAL